MLLSTVAPTTPATPTVSYRLLYVVALPIQTPDTSDSALNARRVLVVVFGFLDLYMTDKAVTFWFAVGIFSVSGFLLVSGILAELTRKE